MSKVHELRALLEILDVCYTELNELLMTDHPLADHLEKIAKERQTIEDIEYLIADVKAEIACKELHKYLMNEYAITSQMNRLSV
jgi:hypothetical protein